MHDGGLNQSFRSSDKSKPVRACACVEIERDFEIEVCLIEEGFGRVPKMDERLFVLAKCCRSWI